MSTYKKKQMPCPATQHAPDVFTSLNYDLTADKTRVAEKDAILRYLNAQVPEIVSGMETLAAVVERPGVKKHEWEDECPADGQEGPETVVWRACLGLGLVLLWRFLVWGLVSARARFFAFACPLAFLGGARGLCVWVRVAPVSRLFWLGSVARVFGCVSRGWWWI